MKRYYDSFRYHANQRRSVKRLWKSVGLGNAFRHNLEYHCRLQALKRYYDLTEKAIRKVYAITETEYQPDSIEKVKAQLDICYTNFPSAMAAYASIGHTVWVQYKILTHDRAINLYMKELLVYAKHKYPAADEESLHKVLLVISQAITERIVYEELKRSGLEMEIESFRIYLASANPLIFDTLPGIIVNAVLLGDLLPDYGRLTLHPFSKKLLKTISDISSGYIIALNGAGRTDLITVGADWVKDILQYISAYLPYKDPFMPKNRSMGNDDMGFTAAEMEVPKSFSDEFPGFNALRPPMFEESDLDTWLKSGISGRKGNEILRTTAGVKSEPHDTVKKFNQEMTDLVNTITCASGQSNYEDIRSEIIQSDLLGNAFSPGLIQGSPFEGNEVSVNLGGDIGKVTGSIFDQTIELSYDMPEVERLLRKAEPLIRAMKKNIYPNTENTMHCESVKNSGIFDGQRLPIYKMNDTIYKRITYKKRLIKDGKATVLIVADGSGSMNPDKTMLLKLLTASWIKSTLATRIVLMAGIYNESSVSKGRYGSVLKWIVHPFKTSALSKNDYLKAVASIPSSGHGGQQDALALSYCIEEALKVAKTKKGMLYLTHLTDAGFCQSFMKGMTPEDEVLSVINHYKKELGEYFHYTLVGLDISSAGKLVRIADKSILLSASELSNPFMAASQVGLYVSSCLKERNRKMNM